MPTGPLLLALAACLLFGCEPTESMTNGDTAVDEQHADGMTGPDTSAESCNYEGKSMGVCGRATVDAKTGECTLPPGTAYQASETTCGDDFDNDCDGVTDEQCPCQYKSSDSGVCNFGRIDPDSGECRPPDNYEADETICDGKDNDCDGEIDEQGCTCTGSETRSCYSGPRGTAGQGICTRGTQTCTSDNRWGSCKGEVTPAEGEEKTCDGKDNDCDGEVDEVPDKPCPKKHGVCANTTVSCNANAGAYPNCESAYPPAYESGNETRCDGKDNDCDGMIDEGTCDIWVLRSNASTWTKKGIPTTAQSQHAPNRAIRAAFDIENANKIGVLTDKTYHRYNPSTNTWEHSQSIKTFARALVGKNIRSGYSVPGTHTGGDGPGKDGVTILYGANGMSYALIGTHDPATGDVVWNESRELSAPTGPAAPTSRLSITARWLTVTDPLDWASGNPNQLCGRGGSDVTVYSAALANSRLHMLDAGSCFDYFAEWPFGQSPPGRITGAPPASTIGAFTWHRGKLWAFRGN